MKTGRELFQTGILCAVALALGILGDTKAHAQPGSQLWVRRYGNTKLSDTDARCVVVDADGNVIVAGNIFGRTRDTDWLIVKYSNGGVPLWTNYYNGPGNAADQVNAVAVDAHGNVFVTGYSDGFGINCNDCYPSYDYATIAYSSAGVPLWTNRYGGPVEWESDDEAVAIAVDGNGDVAVTGFSSRNAYLYDWVTIKYSGAGGPLWTNRFNGPVNIAAMANAVAVDGNGNLFVTGDSYGTGSSYDYTTIKYSGAGVPLWTNRYGGTTNGSDSASAVAVDGSGNVFVTGSSHAGSNMYNCVTIAYANDGGALWTNRYPPSGTGYSAGGRALGVDSGGNVFVAGGSAGSSGQADYLTLAYSNIGELLWTNRYHGPNANVQSVATALAVDLSGNVFVTGYSWGNIFDFVTLAYSNAGAPLWTNRYDGPGHNYDIPSAVAVDGSGNVFVAGYSVRSGGGFDSTTIQYSGAGVPLWVDRHTGPVNVSDRATAVAVDGGGNVFVTGISTGTAEDYVTLKYSAAGVPLWTNRYNNEGPNWRSTDVPTALAVDANGNAVVTGYSFSISSGYDYATLKYSGAGVRLWGNRFNYGSGLSDQRASAVAMDRNANVFVTGSSATVAYSSAGVQLWVDLSLSGTAIALDGSGNVFVAGSTGFNYAIAAFSSAGARFWLNPYDGSEPAWTSPRLWQWTTAGT